LKQLLANHKFQLWVIALPAVLHFLIFRYVPLLGNVIAFQDYDLFKGIFHSPWVGFKYFEQLFQYPDFPRVLKNTLLLSFYRLVWGFPAPIILALLLNEIRKIIFMRTVQTMIYLPHFLSWVIVGGIFIQLLSIHGIINDAIAAVGLERIDFLNDSRFFRSILVISGTWKEVGYGTIIYLAAIVGVNPNLYEAAEVDGAGRWRQMWHVTLPAITPAIVVLLLLRLGHMLESNAEEVLMYWNPLVRDVGDVIDTYVYQVGLLGAQFSYTTAIGIFKSVVGVILVFGMNRLAKLITGESIY
jgi:putative aldouronate transport system permease protein